MSGIGFFTTSIAMHLAYSRFIGKSASMKKGLILAKSIASTNFPVAKKVPESIYFGAHPVHKDQFRGDSVMVPPLVRKDDYNWLRDETRELPVVIDHLKAENEYCEKDMTFLKGFRETLYKEMLSHLKETDEEVPHRHGDYLYYSKTQEGLSYRIHCRKAFPDGVEEVVLDENELAKGHEQSNLSGYEPSSSHKMVAYGIDYTGYETYSLHIIEDVASGRLHPDVIENCSGDFVWGTDESTLFYTTMDEEHRPDKVFLHVLGTPQSSDVCIHQEDDVKYWMHLGKTANDRFLVFGADSKETSENYVLDLQGVTGGVWHLNAATSAVKLVQKRRHMVRYDVEQHGDFFYSVTNADGAKNHKLVRAPVEAVLNQVEGVPVAWEDVRAYQPTEQIDDLEVFENHIAVFGRQNGVQRLWIVDLQKNVSEWLPVPFAEVAYSLDAGHNCVFKSDTVRLSYSSFVTPRQVVDYNMRTGQAVVLKQQEVPHYDAAQYETRRIEALAHDGKTLIPMSVVYKKNALRTREDGSVGVVNQPTLLYGYGSYGACIDPSFDYKRITLLDRGVVYVIAHIRGGGEMGKAWYEDEGKYLTKRNTFEDFAACAEHLIKEKMTASDRLAIVGRSAGGLLIGATINMYPHLFKAAVADVPFVDVMNTMSDPTIPLTAAEWEEWGNPNEAKYHEYMLSYSPYDNVARQDYPAILVTAGLNDPRVAYWEPAKWVAKLRELKTDSNPLYFKTDLESGHFSASDRYKYIKETAFEYAFILDQIGSKNKI